MAEPIFLKLKHLGDTVIDYIDLFDEGVYGADKLFLRGRYTSFEEVKSAIEECLALGSPTEDPASEANKLAYNRFSQPDKVFFIPDQHDAYAMKAQFMLQFAIRIRLYDNFAYIHFGIPWARKWDVINDCPNAKYPFGKYSKGQTFTIEDLQILRYSWISIEDAETILKKIGLSNPIPIPVSETGKLQSVINNITAKISETTIDLDSIDKKLQDIKSIQDEIDGILAEAPSTSLQEKQTEQQGEYTAHSSTLATHKQTLTTAQSTLQSNKDKLDKGISQSEYDEFLKLLNESLDSISELSTQAKELKIDVDDLYARVVELKKLCDERKAMKDKIEALKQEVAALESKIEQNKVTVQEIETVVSTATTKLEQHDGKGIPMKSALETISAEKEAISTKGTEIESTKGEIDTEVAKIEQDFADDVALAEIDTQIQATTAKNSDAISTVDKAKVQLDNLKTQADEINSTVDEMIVVIDSLEEAQGNIGNDDASLHENLEKIEEFNTTITSLEEALVTKEDPEGTVAAKVETLKNAVTALNESLTMKDTEIAMATRQGDSIDDSIEGFDASTKDQIKSELATFEATVNEITTFMDNADTEVERITSELSDVETEVNNLTDLYPSNGGASADENTVVTSTITKSEKKNVDYDIVTIVDASQKPVEPRTISGGQVLEDGTVTPAQMVAYVVSCFWERPSEDVTKYEVQFAGQESWGKSAVDTQGTKKGARINMHFGDSEPMSGEITLKWKKEDETPVSTVNIKVDFTGVTLAQYALSAQSLTVDDTKLNLKFDKKVPNKMTLNIIVDGIEEPVQIKSTGFLDTLTLSTEADEQTTYSVTAVDSKFLNVTDLPVTYTPAGS